MYDASNGTFPQIDGEKFVYIPHQTPGVPFEIPPEGIRYNIRRVIDSGGDKIYHLSKEYTNSDEHFIYGSTFWNVSMTLTKDGKFSFHDFNVLVEE